MATPGSSTRRPHYGGWGLALYTLVLALTALIFGVIGATTGRPAMALIALPVAVLLGVCAWLTWPSREKFQVR